MRGKCHTLCLARLMISHSSYFYGTRETASNLNMNLVYCGTSHAHSVSSRHSRLRHTGPTMSAVNKADPPATKANSAFYPSGVGIMNTSFGWEGKGMVHSVSG